MSKMEAARLDSRMVELRTRITAVMGHCTSIWSADAEVGEVSLKSTSCAAVALPG